MTAEELRRRDFERILLIKPSSPGDIIHALPVFHALRRRYPRAQLSWLVASPFANLIETCDGLNEVIPFDRGRYGRVIRDLAATRDFAAFLGDLRRREFDLVIDLQGLIRSAFLARATGASVRIGFAGGREFSWAFYSHRIPRGPKPDEHAVTKNLRVCPMLGLDDEPPTFALSLTTDDRSYAQALRAEVGVAENDRYAVLVPGTRWETKCWPPDRFGFLAREIAERFGMRSVLVGGASDQSIARIAEGASGDSAVSLCGRTTLRQLAALIETAAIVVTADSTPMHLAAALDRPLVALFGPTNPARTGPYGRMGDVLRLDLPCSPCYYRRMRQCPYDHACMQRLEVASVFDAARTRLNAVV